MELLAAIRALRQRELAHPTAWLRYFPDPRSRNADFWFLSCRTGAAVHLCSTERRFCGTSDSCAGGQVL
jgi:hypothetical protein